jgi:hypothetical protein
MRDYDDVSLNVEDLPRVEPGIYDAVVLSTKKVYRFGLATVEFRFRLVSPGPAFDVQLLGYCSLGPPDKARIRRHSKLASWVRLLAGYSGGSPSRVTLRSFRQYWFRVRVETTTHNFRQRPLAPHDQYSSVTDIMEVVGTLDANARSGERQATFRKGEVS